MKTIKTSEAVGPALDWLVARCKGIPVSDIRFDGKRIYRRMRDGDGNLTNRYMTGSEFLFSTCWESGGPIIEREGINIRRLSTGLTAAAAYYDLGGDHAGSIKYRMTGETALVAAMRCFVASKFGDCAEVPEELS